MATTLPPDPELRTKMPAGRERLSIRLLGSAAKKSYDPVVDIDWAAPIPTQLYGLSPEWSTLFGTPMWEALTEDQRITLTIHEYCSIFGCGDLVRVSAHAADAA